VLELAWREVARGPGAVGGDRVHVHRAVEHPVLAVQPAEQALDLSRRLPGGALGAVALVTGAAGEGDRATVGRPGHVVEAIGHRAQRANLAHAADRKDVQRRVALLLAASRREREVSAVR
jgi:hypothetical protein